MKKYLLGICLALSMQATAYAGATANFTKSIFDKIDPFPNQQHIML